MDQFLRSAASLAVPHGETYDAVMEMRALDHIVLCVDDVAATRQFYERVLGMASRQERPGKWSLHFGANKISLQDAGAAPGLASRTLHESVPLRPLYESRYSHAFARWGTNLTAAHQHECCHRGGRAPCRTHIAGVYNPPTGAIPRFRLTD